MNAYAVIGFTIIPGSLLFAGGVLLGLVIDTWDTLSLILASISIGLAIAIFAIQQSQGGKLTGLVTQIDETTRENQRLLSDKRELYADNIVTWWLRLDDPYWITFIEHDRLFRAGGEL